MTSALSVTQANFVPREEAIGRLGVTYSHEGSWRNPIKELLGRRAHNFDPLSEASLFDIEAAAVAHVQGIATIEAARQVEKTGKIIADPALRARLWLARNWGAMRKREVGILATHALLEDSRREYGSVLERGAKVEIQRLPAIIRLSAVIDLDTPVWVVDTTAFPRGDISVREDEVESWSFIDVPGHDHFDILIRYRLKGTVGSFAYDYGDTTQESLQGPRGGVSVFLSEASARHHLSIFAHQARSVLDRAGPYTLLLPPPSPQVELPAIEAPRETSNAVIPADVSFTPEIEPVETVEPPTAATAAEPVITPAELIPMTLIAPDDEFGPAPTIAPEPTPLPSAEVPTPPQTETAPAQAAVAMTEVAASQATVRGSRLAAVKARVAAILSSIRPRTKPVVGEPANSQVLAIQAHEPAPEITPLMDFIRSGLKIRRPMGVSAEASLTGRALASLDRSGSRVA